MKTINIIRLSTFFDVQQSQFNGKGQIRNNQ